MTRCDHAADVAAFPTCKGGCSGWVIFTTPMAKMSALPKAK
jgi:hypothetical protein